MKIFITLIAFLAFINIQAEEVFIKNKDKLIVDQKGMFWCWAASVESLHKYYDIKTPQEKVIKKIKGKEVFIYLPNQHDYRYALTPYHFLSFRKVVTLPQLNVGQIFTNSEIEQAIRDSRPVIIFYGVHVSIIVGFKKKNGKIIELELMDPKYKLDKFKSPFIKVPVYGDFVGREMFFAPTKVTKIN